ncbi:DarT ssDNA thymidine ADP-ribosyltransferase family protein [Desulfitibacter alkalitolerans]|uniref:DarT ssDNA thymidine ADP-ribosyltransferase family protein n=1 Tax=Desulfitibacter alkalitolerans TaxID=264641 RepID=UPI000484B78D|nr:DarT ssDNA thymidine ADP-ribosyltransferase family protein [Desulfitibacter alkalitolerans]
MTNEFKSDAKEILEHIKNLQQASWLDNSRSWWPKFIYHFTNLDNAISIFKKGAFYSRAYLEEKGEMITDNASCEVIDQTERQWKEYVRLYFRPRTPTQYRNEGFRPKSQRQLNAHCPFPIYFLFDPKKLLIRKNVFFSDGSLAAAGAFVSGEANFFKNIPFELVYHNSYIMPGDTRKIVYHRHAEVIVKDTLDFDCLNYIWCRSEAEYRTLLYLLPSKIKKQFKNKIGSGQKGNFFERKWIFVEEVDMNTDKIVFKINKPIVNCDPFHIKCEIKEKLTGRTFAWENNKYSIDNYLELSLAKLKRPEFYEAKLFFDEQLMFCDSYTKEIEVPF